MHPPLVTYAVRAEVAPIAARNGVDCRVLLTGIGGANARRVVERFLSSQSTPPPFVVSCGFAGGLQPGLSAGEVLFDLDPELPCAETLRAAGARAGRFVSSEKLVPTAVEKRALGEASGADAVEMESAAIRRVCGRYGIPSATVRVILDPVDEDLPLDFRRFLTAEYRLRPIRLLGAAVASPSVARALIRFHRHCRRYARELAKVVVSVVVER